MEQTLLTLLSKDAYYCTHSHYILELATAIAVFLEPQVKKTLMAGYGGGIYERTSTNKYLMQIASLLPPDTEYGRIYLNHKDLYTIEQLFEGSVYISKVHHEDNNPRTKGYAFRIEYSFETIRDVSNEATAMLQYIVKVLSNNELKDASETVHAQKLKEAAEKEAMQQEEERQQKQVQEEQKRKHDEEHRPKYLAMLKRSETIVVPTRKKDAIQVNYEDMDALAYSLYPYSYEEYPSDIACSLKDFFHGDPFIKVWKPNTILHCILEDNREFTLRKGSWCIAIKPVRKRTAAMS